MRVMANAWGMIEGLVADDSAARVAVVVPTENTKAPWMTWESAEVTLHATVYVPRSEASVIVVAMVAVPAPVMIPLSTRVPKRS